METRFYKVPANILQSLYDIIGELPAKQTVDLVIAVRNLVTMQDAEFEEQKKKAAKDAAPSDPA